MLSVTAIILGDGIRKPSSNFELVYFRSICDYTLENDMNPSVLSSCYELTIGKLGYFMLVKKKDWRRKMSELKPALLVLKYSL